VRKELLYLLVDYLAFILIPVDSAVNSNFSGNFGVVNSKHSGQHPRLSRHSSTKYFFEGESSKKQLYKKKTTRLIEEDSLDDVSGRPQRRNRKRLDTTKSNLSKKSKNSQGTKKNVLSITFDDSNSKSNSDMYGIQSAYHDMMAGAGEQGSLMSKVENTYYHILRNKLARRPSPREESPEDFKEQVNNINQNVITPNNEKLAYIEIGEKDEFERLKDYTDKLPLLKERKKLMKLWRYFSLICYKIIAHPIFDNFILLTIIINSMALALDDPTDDKSSLPQWVDTSFLIIYTIEMFLKIFGMGFIMGKHSYLRDYWNVMDFVIVVTAYIPYVVSSNSVDLRSLRSLRIARPLRTISSVESLRVIILTLIAAFGPLLNTLFVLLFLFLIFAIGGLQLFQGLLKKRCMEVETGKPVYSAFSSTSHNQLYCSMDSDCLNSNDKFICAKMVWNPLHGTMSFDNIGNSFLMVFQIMSLEGWTDIMIALQKTFNPWVTIYFVFLIFMGTFFLLNMTLAVLKTEFTESKEKNTGGGKKKKLRKPKSHDEKQIQKLHENKLQFIELLRKLRAGGLVHSKYELKKNKLIGIGNAEALRRKQTTKNRESRWQKLFSSLFGKTKIMSLGTNRSGGVLESINPGDSKFANLIKMAYTKSKESKENRGGSLDTIAPLIKNDETKAITAQPEVTVNPPDNKAITTGNESYSSPKGFLPIAKNARDNAKVTIDKSTVDSENLPGPPTIKLPPKDPNEDKNDLRKKPDVLSPRNGGGISIKITEPMQSSPQDIEFSRSMSRDPIQSKIMEEAESSREQSNPSSVMSPRSRTNIVYIKPNESERDRAPVRPSTSYKQTLGETTLETGAKKNVQIIGIAGTRKKNNAIIPADAFDAQAGSTSARRKSSTEGVNKNYNKKPTKERTIIEEVNEDESFFEFIKDQEAPAEVKKKDDLNDRIRKKINKLGKLQNSRPTFSHLLQKMSTIDIDHDEELRSIPQHGTIAILDDSDIFEARPKKHHQERLPTVRSNGKKKTLHPNRKTFKNKTIKMTKKSKDQTVTENNDAVIKLENNEQGDIEEDLEDQEETFIFDLKIMKPEPKFVYHESTSHDDILPSLKEKIKKEKEMQEYNRIKNAKLPLKYPITSKDEEGTEKRRSAFNSLASSKSTIAVKKSLKAITMREIRRGGDDVDDFNRTNTIRDQGTEFRRSMSFVGGSRSLARLTAVRRIGETGPKRPDRWGVIVEDEEDLTEEQLKDKQAILERINKQFENEVQWEDPNFVKTRMKEERFFMEEEWLKIRVTIL